MSKKKEAGQLNPKEQRILDNVIESMITEKLMETGFTGLLFYLTEKGENLLMSESIG